MRTEVRTTEDNSHFSSENEQQSRSEAPSPFQPFNKQPDAEILMLQFRPRNVWMIFSTSEWRNSAMYNWWGMDERRMEQRPNTSGGKCFSLCVTCQWRDADCIKQVSEILISHFPVQCLLLLAVGIRHLNSERALFTRHALVISWRQNSRNKNKSSHLFSDLQQSKCVAIRQW